MTAMDTPIYNCGQRICCVILDVGYILDLKENPPRHCTGCWFCWTRTPGQCVQKELDEFYRQYLAADEVVILSRVTQGFVSSKLKNLFDRMIPLFLPYISYAAGESMHVPRYETMPHVTIYYEGAFESEQEREDYIKYLNRTMFQFHTKCEIKPMEQDAARAVME